MDDLPPQLSGLAAFIVALGIAIPVLIQYWRKVNAPEQTGDREQLRMLGAALGDSAAIDRVTASVDRVVHESRVNGERLDDIGKAVGDMARAIEGVAHAISSKAPRAPRRRG